MFCPYRRLFLLVTIGTMNKFIPKYVIVSKEVKNLQFTNELLQRLPNVSIEYVTEIEPVVAELLNSDGYVYDLRNQYLFVCKNPGRFYQWCPGTKKYICCGYKILHIIQNCPLNCSYCILQAYFKNPFIFVYVNLDDMFKELNIVLDKKAGKYFRIGTGEFTDSLFLDHITLHSKILIPYFAQKRNVIIELKTKTDIIDNLFKLNHKRRTIVSWSLNSEKIAQEEESNCTSTDSRIKAAEICQEPGYRIGFHFDPIIHYDGWEEDYKLVIDKIFYKIRPENIVWISMGCLRFMPDLKSIIRERFPKSKIIYEEFIIAEDGKMRYLKPLRIHIYKTLYNYIRRYSKDVTVYLCMEREDVWESVFGFKNFNNKKLIQLLDESVFSKM